MSPGRWSIWTAMSGAGSRPAMGIGVPSVTGRTLGTGSTGRDGMRSDGRFLPPATRTGRDGTGRPAWRAL